MRPRTLVARSLRHYWRANVAVVLGVAAAAAALGGSLVVGDSVRGSLARTALERLSRVTHAVESERFFREGMVEGLAPVIALEGVATHGTTRRRAGDVLVYGVDPRYWALQGVSAPEVGDREAIVSEALAAELEAAPGESIVVRLHAAGEIPGSSLFGRRDDPARALRLTVREVRSRAELGELALRPRSGAVRSVFLPLRALQRALGLEGRANTLLAAETGEGATATLARTVAESVRLEDLGLRVRVLAGAGALQLESTSALVDDRLAAEALAVAHEQGLAPLASLVYLANALRVADREVPYSLVAAVDERGWRAIVPASAPSPADSGQTPIVLNDWTARALGARPGDRVTLEYFLWGEEGKLDTASAAFTLAATTPMRGLAADRDLVPEYPGITESLHLSDWEPPFPVDLDRIGPEDEAYWDRHRATPKAFVPLAAGQRLWSHPQGRLTSLRLAPPAGGDLEASRAAFSEALLVRLRGTAGNHDGALGGPGPRVVPVREAALAAARGATDFGEYFTYFSFFLVVASLLLAGLFFRLGLEQRLREVGLLEALGFAAARVRRLFLAEGLALAALGAALGALGALGYAALVMWGLRALWAGTLGTGDLALHVRPVSPLLGALGAAVAAALAIAWTLRDLRKLSPRRLLAGALEPWTGARPMRRLAWPALLAVAALALVAASLLSRIPETAGFFGAGGLLLLAALLLARQAVAGRPQEALALRSVTGLGLRGVAFRPDRSALCIALVAAATFVILAVGAFRQDGAQAVDAPDGPTGGYRLSAWSLVPLHHDLASAEGREALGLDAAALDGVGIARFRARRGDDASCLNLYAPGEPTILGAPGAFIRAGRFAFQASLARTEEERSNPWRLLEREREPDGTIPVVADAGALAYVLHRRLGEAFPLGATDVRVRVVAALRPGLLQGELVTSERHFETAFPGRTGASFFLLDVPKERAEAVGEALESGLADHGFDVASTAARLRDLHRVENTYIATFQALGALGLLLGVVGLATVLARNALEQRGELALLRAVGYRAAHVTRMVLAENAALVGLGFLAGAVPALVAILPTILGGRGGVPLALAAGLLVALAGTGALVSWLAVLFIRRLPMVASLRSE